MVDVNLFHVIFKYNIDFEITKLIVKLYKLCTVVSMCNV